MGPKFSKKERAQMNLSRFPFFTQTKEQDRCHVHSDPMSIRGQAFLRPGDTGESRPCKSCPASRTGIHAAIALRLAADSAAKGLQGGSCGQYNQQRRVDTPLHTQEVTGSSPVAPTIQTQDVRRVAFWSFWSIFGAFWLQRPSLSLDLRYSKKPFCGSSSCSNPLRRRERPAGCVRRRPVQSPRRRSSTNGLLKTIFRTGTGDALPLLTD